MQKKTLTTPYCWKQSVSMPFRFVCPSWWSLLFVCVCVFLCMARNLLLLHLIFLSFCMFVYLCYSFVEVSFLLPKFYVTSRWWWWWWRADFVFACNRSLLRLPVCTSQCCFSVRLMVFILKSFRKCLHYVTFFFDISTWTFATVLWYTAICQIFLLWLGFFVLLSVQLQWYRARFFHIQ